MNANPERSYLVSPVEVGFDSILDVMVLEALSLALERSCFETITLLLTRGRHRPRIRNSFTFHALNKSKLRRLHEELNGFQFRGGVSAAFPLRRLAEELPHERMPLNREKGEDSEGMKHRAA